MIADVLKEHYFPVLKRRCKALCAVSDYVGSHLYFAAEKLGKTLGDRSKGELL